MRERITIEFTDDMKGQLETLARVQGGRSISSVVREIVAKGLEEHRRRAGDQQGVAA